MSSRLDTRFLDAFFRLLAARPGFDAAALVATGPGGPTLVAATPAFRLLAPAAREWPGPHELPTAAGRGTAPLRVAPARLGLAAAFAAVVPVAAAEGEAIGHLLVADARPRRLTPASAAMLVDAAALTAPILAAAAEPAQMATAPPGAVRSRAGAQRLIESALGRSGGDATLMVLDIDRFRAVNEALGIGAGDALLAVTATRIQQALGGSGRMVRLEGDRFVIVAPREGPGPRTLAQRLIQAVGQPLTLGGRTVAMQASVGIAAARTAEAPPATLMMQADSALRRAKTEGRNRIVLHEPAQAVAALERSRLELDLPAALADGQLHLAYQPFVDLRDGSIAGVEALLRWRHPTRGALMPATFIPMAEATGQILQLGRWALRHALAEAAHWPQALRLAVNISPLQFHQPGFLAEVDAALDETGFPPDRLEFEITETVLMRDNPETTGQLRALIGRGIHIALDDFGTGYSALAYLGRLPHHRIKLDKAFVQDLANPATAELIRAIIALARAQGVGVTAEGVERSEHLALVRHIGFTHAQGFAIGAPTADPATLLVQPAELQACNS